MNPYRNYNQPRLSVPQQAYPPILYPENPNPQTGPPWYPILPSENHQYPQNFSAHPQQGYSFQEHYGVSQAYRSKTTAILHSFPNSSYQPILPPSAHPPLVYHPLPYSQSGQQSYSQNCGPTTTSWGTSIICASVLCAQRVPRSHQEGKGEKYFHVGPGIPSMRQVFTYTPAVDAQILHKAFQGMGCDKKILIDILTHRSSAYREGIKDEYFGLYGKSLIDRTNSELSFPLKTIALSLLYTGAYTDAYLIKKATKKLRTDPACLINIFVTRSSYQLSQVEEAFRHLYKGKSLERNIASGTTGNFYKILLFLLHTPRKQTSSCYLGDAASIATQIYSRSKFALNASESWIPLFCETSYDQFRLVLQEFQKLYGKTLTSYLKGYFNGDYLKTLLSICTFVENPIHYWSKQLKEGFQNNKINIVSLVVCTRSEIDLASVLQDFERNFKSRPQDELKKAFNSTCPDSVDALLMLMGS